jgi:predicted ATP-grasp superfamily ATP-dependent carboligase
LNNSVPVVVIAPGYHGHAIARSLGRLGVPVYGVHADSGSPAAKSRYWRENYIWDIATAFPEESVDWLLRLARKIGSPPILIPTDDNSCVFLADRAEELRDGFLFPNQPSGLTRLLSNKEQMYRLCKKHSVPAAETLFPKCRDDVIEFLESVTFPVMLKGIDTLALRERTGVKMVLVHDAKTLLKLYDEMETPESPNLMLQEYLSGGSRTVWMFDGYFDDESNCLFGLTANMIRQYPANTGVTSLGVCITNNTVAKQTRDFMKALGYRGPLDIGYKYDERSGQYKAIDANPRIGRTFRLLVDSTGMDVARALYLDLTGQPVIPGEPREYRKWVVENFDLISSPKYIRDSKLSVREWLRSYKGVEEAFWFARDDLAPFMMMGWSSLQWAFDRLFTNAREEFSYLRGKERRRNTTRYRPRPQRSHSDEADASPTLVSRG